MNDITAANPAFSQGESDGVTSPSISGSNRRKLGLYLLLSALFFFGLWLMGYPLPMGDDLFDGGVALNLASGGDLSNPLLARQHFPGHYFYMYPPVHPYIEAGWLKIVGISANSMTGFQILILFIGSAATVFFFCRLNVSRWLWWLVPLAMTSTFLPVGLRPEATAVALLMCGVAVVDYCRGKIALFTGFFLMALGASATPRLALFGVATMIAVVYPMVRNRDPKSKYPGLAVLFTTAAAGGLVAFGLFLWMINFHLFEFWRVFRYHAQQITAHGYGHLLVMFFTKSLFVPQLPALPLLLALIIFSFRCAASAAKRTALILAGAIIPVFLIKGLGPGAIWFIFLGVILLTEVAERQLKSRRLRISLAVVTSVVLVMANIRAELNIVGFATGKISKTPGEKTAEARALLSTPEHTILVDDSTARYVFDYHLPPGTIYYPFSMEFPNSQAVMIDSLHPTDICILGPSWARYMVDRHCLDLPLPVWRFWLRRWSYPCRPRDVFIIHAGDLHCEPAQ